MTKRDELIALADLRRANVTRQKEWDVFDQLTLAYRGNELAGEVGEACNVIKKLERERLGIKGSRDTVEHLAEELADIIICTDLIAMQAGIDLSSAVIAKFNASSEKVGLKTRLSALEAPAAGDGEPVAWRWQEESWGDYWIYNPEPGWLAEQNNIVKQPLYTAPPADAGMREALDMVAHSGKFQCFDDDAWDVVNKALTAPGATTKSDGGEPTDAQRQEALRLLKAEDDRQSKLHDLLETIREQIRIGVEPEHRPEGLFNNIQNAVYAMRGRTLLMNDAAITCVLYTDSSSTRSEVAVEQQPPEWLWWGEVDGKDIVTFGRWPKRGAMWRYKLAEIQPTEHDHPKRLPATRAVFEIILAALNYDGPDINSLTVGEIRRALP